MSWPLEPGAPGMPAHVLRRKAALARPLPGWPLLGLVRSECGTRPSGAWVPLCPPHQADEVAPLAGPGLGQGEAWPLGLLSKLSRSSLRISSPSTQVPWVACSGQGPSCPPRGQGQAPRGTALRSAPGLRIPSAWPVHTCTHLPCGVLAASAP